MRLQRYAHWNSSHSGVQGAYLPAKVRYLLMSHSSFSHSLRSHYYSRHQYYMSKLAEYGSKSPLYMRRLRDDLWTEIGYVHHMTQKQAYTNNSYSDACRFHIRQEDSDSGSDLDFDAMEASATPSLAMPAVS